MNKKILNNYLEYLTESEVKECTCDVKECSLKEQGDPDQLPVGKHNDIPNSNFDQHELAMGIIVEKEHTDNPEIAAAIARDHLSEFSDYYTRLKKMEDGARNEKNK